MFVWIVTYFDDTVNTVEIIGVYSSVFKAYKAILEDCALCGELIPPQAQYWNDFDAKNFWVEIDEDMIHYEIQRAKFDE